MYKLNIYSTLYINNPINFKEKVGELIQKQKKFLKSMLKLI
jgi:hypothetical protein